MYLIIYYNIGTIIDKTIPVEKFYDVNTYRINEFYLFDFQYYSLSNNWT